MTYQHIIVSKETERKFAVAQLNRPQALNALNFELMTELVSAFRDFAKDPVVNAVVLAGNEKAFAAGADIKEMATATSVEMLTKGYLEMWDELHAFKKPIVVAVSGYCLGGGLELAMIGDIIIASETAKFGQPEINIGVIPGAGGTQRLARLAGKMKAMELILTGRQFGAEEALQMGLANKIFPVDSYLDEAKKLAAEIASKPPMAVRLAKEAVLRAASTNLQNDVEFERRLFALLFATEDMREGMQAFIEKRKPVWKGR
ncbi:MAG: enoyl-CoA hydratase-related protein [Chloroherpetonaceae bacterium]|nr:enoyl-CoA hydratase-related protein [Chloroherpetonaceae bacterium]